MIWGYLHYIFFLSLFYLVTFNYGITIDEKVAKELEELLAKATADTVYEYPSRDVRHEPLVVAHSVSWNTPATLVLVSKEDIIFKSEGHIRSHGSGTIILKAGMENEKNRDHSKEPTGTVIFEEVSVPHLHIGRGKVKIYYNPSKGQQTHKYWNSLSRFYEKQISGVRDDTVEMYMLVNHVRDLQDIRKALFKNYALSQDINASETIDWDLGKGFRPLSAPHFDGDGMQPFSRNFDGNGYTIYNLFINRPDEDYVGIFGKIVGGWAERTRIENLSIKNALISGNNFVGILAGWAEDTVIYNINIAASNVTANDIVGGVIGVGIDIKCSVSILNSKVQANKNYHGLIFGQADKSAILLTHYVEDICADVTQINDEKVPHKRTPFGFLSGLVIVCANSRCILGSDALLQQLFNSKEINT